MSHQATKLTESGTTKSNSGPPAQAREAPTMTKEWAREQETKQGYEEGGRGAKETRLVRPRVRKGASPPDASYRRLLRAPSTVQDRAGPSPLRPEISAIYQLVGTLCRPITKLSTSLLELSISLLHY